MAKLASELNAKADFSFNNSSENPRKRRRDDDDSSVMLSQVTASPICPQNGGMTIPLYYDYPTVHMRKTVT